jgi:hypothetical protein
MNGLKKGLKKLFKQSPWPLFISAFIVSICLAVGTYISSCTDAIDHPLEQVAEQVLKSYGLDVDFSQNKRIKKHDSN